MSDGRADQIKSVNRTVTDDHRNVHELTFLIKVRAAIVDLERHIAALPILQTTPEEPMTDTQKVAARQWISKACLKHHLGKNYSTKFRSNSTPPILPTDDQVLDEPLKSVPRVKIPVVDSAYGIREMRFLSGIRKSLKHSDVNSLVSCIKSFSWWKPRV